MLVKLELTLLIGQFIARPLKVHVGQRTQPIDVFQNRLSSLIIVFAPTTLLTIDGYRLRSAKKSKSLVWY
jgi:hypothetical protein